MKTEIETETSIIQQVRQWKQDNAAEHDFNLAKILEAARVRQEKSGRRIIRLPRVEQGVAPNR